MGTGVAATQTSTRGICGGFAQQQVARMIAKEQFLGKGQEILVYLSQSGFTPENIRNGNWRRFAPNAGVAGPQQQVVIPTVQQETAQIMNDIKQLISLITALVQAVLSGKQLPVNPPAPTVEPTPTPTVEPAPAPVEEAKIVDKEKMDARFNAADANGDKVVTLDEYKEYYANRVAKESGKAFTGKDDPELAKAYKEAENVFKAIATKNPITDKLELSKDRFDKIVKYYDAKDGEADGKINEKEIIKDIEAVKDGQGEIKSATGKSLEEVLEAMA